MTELRPITSKEYKAQLTKEGKLICGYCRPNRGCNRAGKWRKHRSWKVSRLFQHKLG